MKSRTIKLICIGALPVILFSLSVDTKTVSGRERTTVDAPVAVKTDSLCFTCYHDSIHQVWRIIEREIAASDSMYRRANSNMQQIRRNNQDLRYILEACAAPETEVIQSEMPKPDTTAVKVQTRKTTKNK